MLYEDDSKTHAKLMEEARELKAEQVTDKRHVSLIAAGVDEKAEEVQARSAAYQQLSKTTLSKWQTLDSNVNTVIWELKSLSAKPNCCQW